MATKMIKDAAFFVTNAFDMVLNAPVISAGQLHILGGQMTEGQLNAFLQVWQGKSTSDFAWAMIETVDKFDVCKINSTLGEFIDDVTLLERIRLFGETGDLDVRRNGMQFHWRFIGNKTAVLPNLTSFSAVDFWQAAPHTTLREVTRSYYQWREQDKRVNAQWAATIGLSSAGMWLKQKQYLENGRVAFVRYVGFEEKSA